MALNNTTTGFGAYQSVLGSQTGSWKGSFKVDSTNTTLSSPTCTIHYTSNTGTLPTCTNAGNGSATFYSYAYPYKLTVIGQSNSNETNTVEEQGTIVLTVTINSSTSTNTNFAGWGMFIDQSPICDGSYLVPGTITGPVFTNGAWNFGTSGSYICPRPGGQPLPESWVSVWQLHPSPNSSYTSGSQTIHPTFQSGVLLNQGTITLPRTPSTGSAPSLTARA